MQRIIGIIDSLVTTAFFIFVGVLVGQPCLSAEEQRLLSTKDIRPMMQEFFAQHIQEKSISLSVIKNSFPTFLVQFDRDRLYLLEEEVDRYRELPDSFYQKALDEYQRDDFESYRQVNQVAQNAIHRARSVREQLYKNAQTLLQEREKINRIPIDFPVFAKNLGELHERIHYHMHAFILQERERFGDAAVKAKLPVILRRYEAKMRDEEDTYLYTNFDGNPLPVKEQENLLALHIIKALAHSLDAHTSFLSDSEASEMRFRLQKGMRGLGIVLDEGLEGPEISSFAPHGPASRDGTLKVGDRLIEINGKNIENLSFNNIINELHEASKSKVDLVFLRSKGGATERVRVKLQPALLQIEESRVDVAFEPYGQGIIGKIKLYSFYDGDDGVSSEEDVRRAIEELKLKGRLEALILDLRNNGGGYLSQAVKVAGLFITNGVIVISKYSNGEEQVFRDVDGKVAYDGPLIVLTSRLTASAAEIVAQALQDWGVALVVGDDHTFGKGTIQSQTVTGGGGGAAFKVTVGKYYTVSGKTPQSKGVYADIVVPSPLMQLDIGEAYLGNTIEADELPSWFNDDLGDLKPQTRSWFLRYYTPTLQRKKENWALILDQLRRNSENRIQSNPRYQSSLKMNSQDQGVKMGKSPLNDRGNNDFQIVEATHIAKDMIHMQGILSQRP